MRAKGTSGVGILVAAALIVWVLMNPDAADERRPLGSLDAGSGETPFVMPTEIPEGLDLGIDEEELNRRIQEELEKLAAEYQADFDPQALASLLPRFPSYQELLSDLQRGAEGVDLDSLLAGLQQPAAGTSPDLAALMGAFQGAGAQPDYDAAAQQFAGFIASQLYGAAAQGTQGLPGATSQVQSPTGAAPVAPAPGGSDLAEFERQMSRLSQDLNQAFSGSP